MFSISVVSPETDSRACTCGNPLAADAGACPECDAPTAPPADENAGRNAGRNAKRAANQAAKQAESQAAWRALASRIGAGRRRTLSTLTGVASVGMLGIVAVGVSGRSGSILASAVVPLLVIVCCLFWPRQRDLTRAEYLALPHARSRNGRLRCIHCGALGATLPESGAARRYDCRKCREILFSA
jgi:hypothetical protein